MPHGHDVSRMGSTVTSGTTVSSGWVSRKRTVRATLEKTPPELAADIIDRGMVLTGGSAQLRNIAQLLTQETGVPAYVAENPIACVALGAGRALENYEIMRRSLPIVPE